MGVRVCVCACVKQIRKRRRIRSLRGAELGGAMEETAACRLAAASLGWTPWKRPKQRLPFICSPVFISLLSSRCSSSAGASWWKTRRKH